MNSRVVQLEAQCSWLQTLAPSSEGGTQESPQDAHPTGNDDHHDAGNEVADENNNPHDSVIEVAQPNDHRYFDLLLAHSHPPPLDDTQGPGLPTDGGSSHPSLDDHEAARLNASTAEILLNLPQARFDRPAAVPGSRIDVSQAAQVVSMNNGLAIRSTLDVFFQLLNPLHPIINENQVRADLDKVVFDHSQAMDELHYRQFVALLLLIQAEVKMLDGQWTTPGAQCGWQEFCMAEALMADIQWGSAGNTLTLQCLMLKSRCLLYLQRLHQARDTMALAVRICFQIRLHDQSQWGITDPFDRVMRQRVFWGIFTLERCVSMSCGTQTNLLASDCFVDIPADIDDRGLFPGRPLPEKTSGPSVIPYFCALIRWAQLWETVWDNTFSVRASPAASWQVISTVEDLVMKSLESLPHHLKWQDDDDTALLREWVQPWIWRQRIYFVTVS